MKTKKTASTAKPKKQSEVRSRKMEPLKSKELKNQRFDLDEDEMDVEPETLDENFKGFEESFDTFDDDEDDY